MHSKPQEVKYRSYDINHNNIDMFRTKMLCRFRLNYMVIYFVLYGPYHSIARHYLFLFAIAKITT